MSKLIEIGNFKNNKKYLLLSLLTIVITSVYSYIKIKNIIVLFITLFVIAIAILLYFKKTNYRISMIIILFLLLMGYIFVCPLAVGPDEPGHFYRAYEIANVNAVAIKNIYNDNKGSGDYLPASLDKYNENNATITEETKPYSIRTSALYNPVSYLPQVIGIRITQLFTNNVSNIYYGGRISTAIFAFVLCSIALYILPFGEKIFFVIMTFPMSLEEMSSISTDGFVIPICLFYIAYILYLRYKKQRIDTYDIILLFVLCVTISLCKIVYIVLLLMLFMIPNRMFKNKNYGYISKTIIILTSVILNLIWLSIASEHLVEFRPGVNFAGQISFILNNLLTYINIVVSTTLKRLSLYFYMMVGGSLGKNEITTNFLAIILVTTTFILVSFTENHRIKDVNKKDIFITIFTFACGFVLILTSLYVQWTSVGNEIIEGVQGRYFTPLIPLICILILMIKSKKNDRTKIEWVDKYMTIDVIILVVILYNSMAATDIMAFCIA